MIAIEGGYESQDVNLRKIQDWAEDEFSYLSEDYRSIIALYISELYTLASISKARLQNPDDGTQEKLANTTQRSIEELEAELKGYSLRDVVVKIRKKIIEVGGFIQN